MQWSLDQKQQKNSFEAQGIDTQPFLEGMQPLLYKAQAAARVANGGQILKKDWKIQVKENF